LPPLAQVSSAQRSPICLADCRATSEIGSSSLELLPKRLRSKEENKEGGAEQRKALDWAGAGQAGEIKAKDFEYKS
jgi:hypothetical protein